MTDPPTPVAGLGSVAWSNSFLGPDLVSRKSSSLRKNGNVLECLGEYLKDHHQRTLTDIKAKARGYIFCSFTRELSLQTVLRRTWPRPWAASQKTQTIQNKYPDLIYMLCRTHQNINKGLSLETLPEWSQCQICYKIIFCPCLEIANHTLAYTVYDDNINVWLYFVSSLWPWELLTPFYSQSWFLFSFVVPFILFSSFLLPCSLPPGIFRKWLWGIGPKAHIGPASLILSQWPGLIFPGALSSSSVSLYHPYFPVEGCTCFSITYNGATKRMLWVVFLVSLGTVRKLQDDMGDSNPSSSAEHCGLQAVGSHSGYMCCRRFVGYMHTSLNISLIRHVSNHEIIIKWTLESQDCKIPNVDFLF